MMLEMCVQLYSAFTSLNAQEQWDSLGKGLSSIEGEVAFFFLKRSMKPINRKERS